MTRRPVALALTPAAALRAWPREVPLAALWSGGDAPDARWTVLARAGARRTLGRGASRDEALSLLREVGAGTPAPPGDPDAPPLGPGWIGWMSYDLGTLLEPAAAGPRPATDEEAWPLMEWVRCDEGLAHDRLRDAWWSFGGFDPARLIPGQPAERFEVGPLASGTGREAFEGSVARALEYIRAGDVYQVNLTHRLRGSFAGSTRAFFASLVAGADPWHGAYVETGTGDDRRAVASASPELHLSFDPASRRVITRPMKGTRRADLRADADGRSDLFASAKDAAELHMIVDLMRNDLGRVSDLGSVRVDEARRIERHGGAGDGLWQATATVSGRLRDGLGLADLVAATFPAGSITGAPKIRAMRLIGELEPVLRGPYCGGVGYVADDGGLAFSVAIRTALLHGGVLDYGVGAGIVADSEPETEWRETLDKAGALRAAARGATPPVSVLASGAGARARSGRARPG